MDCVTKARVERGSRRSSRPSTSHGRPIRCVRRVDRVLPHGAILSVPSQSPRPSVPPGHSPPAVVPPSGTRRDHREQHGCSQSPDAQRCARAIAFRTATRRGCLAAGALSRARSAERAKRHRVAQLCDRGNVMFVRLSRFSRHQVRRSTVQHNLVCRRPTRRRRRRRGTVRPKLHSTGRQERDPGDDVVLGCVAMPADGRAGTVLIDQGHGERVGIDAGPVGNFCAQGQQERWKRPSCCPVVRLAEERHSPPSDDTAHLEVRERDIGDRFEEDSLIGVRNEVPAIVETQRPIAFEEGSRRYHVPVW